MHTLNTNINAYNYKITTEKDTVWVNITKHSTITTELKILNSVKLYNTGLKDS